MSAFLFNPIFSPLLPLAAIHNLLPFSRVSPRHHLRTATQNYLFRWDTNARRRRFRILDLSLITFISSISIWIFMRCEKRVTERPARKKYLCFVFPRLRENQDKIEFSRCTYIYKLSFKIRYREMQKFVVNFVEESSRVLESVQQLPIYSFWIWAEWRESTLLWSVQRIKMKMIKTQKTGKSGVRCEIPSRIEIFNLIRRSELHIEEAKCSKTLDQSVGEGELNFPFSSPARRPVHS